MGTATWDFSSLTTGAVTAPLTAASIANVGLSTYEAYVTSYATVPLLQVMPPASTSSPAAAVTNGSYAEITLTASGAAKLTRIQLKGAKGGSTSNRGFAFRSSNDSYATALLEVLNQATVRPNLSTYDQTVDVPFTAGELKLRFYIHSPGSASSQEFDDLILTVEAAGISFSISDVSTGSPEIGTPIANYIRNLSISNFSVGSPSYAAVTLTQRHALAVANVSVGSPTNDPVTFGQRHAFSNAGLTTGSPDIGTPALGSAGTNNFTFNAEYVTGSPTLGPPTFGQRHAFAVPNAGPGSISIGSPTFGQRSSLTIPSFSTGSPDVGTPAISLPAVPDVTLLEENVLSADVEERILEQEEDRLLAAEVEIRRLDYA